MYGPTRFLPTRATGLTHRKITSQLAVLAGARPPFSAGVEDASREGIQRQPKLLGRSLPRFRRCSSATRSVHCRVGPSVQLVGVGHSEPPVKGARLRSLEPLCYGASFGTEIKSSVLTKRWARSPERGSAGEFTEPHSCSHRILSGVTLR